MCQSKKKIPVPEPEKENYECPAVSLGDTTSFIPYAIENSSEINSYIEIYPYRP
ncbi:MAG: hypothetical protein J5723_01690 [Ruminococcus sp.]|nr:hypothetical protein [Ruminococcus sp.]